VCRLLEIKLHIRTVNHLTFTLYDTANIITGATGDFSQYFKTSDAASAGFVPKPG
jgi:hypothetical protein